MICISYKFTMSFEQQRLEYKINEIVQKDNGCTVHFDYKEFNEGF